MEDTDLVQQEQTTPKRTRTKLRKVSKGIKVVIPCEGHSHIIFYTPKGHLVLAHHPDIDLEAELALIGLSEQASNCRCAKFLAAWRYFGSKDLTYQQQANQTNEVPVTLDRVRTDDPNANEADRFWRNYARKHYYKTRNLVTPSWPTNLTEADIYLKHKMQRVGLTLTDKKITYTAEEEAANSVEISYRLMLNSLLTVSRNIVIRLRYNEKQRLLIQSNDVMGLGVRRYFDKTNIDLAVKFIGMSLFRAKYRYWQGRSKVSAENLIQLTKVKNKWFDETDDVGVSIGNNASGTGFYISLDLSNKYMSIAAYLAKKISDALQVVDSALSSRHE